MFSSFNIIFITCICISPMLIAATSGVKRPGDADWVAPLVKFGPSRRPYVQSRKQQLDAEKTSATDSQLDKGKAVLGSAVPKIRKDEISPTTSLDQMWTQAGGKDELDKIIKSIKQQDNRASLSSLPIDSMAGPSSNRYPKDIVKSSNQAPCHQRPSSFHFYSVAQHQYKRRRADALKRLAKYPNSVDLLSQLQRARYTDAIEPLSPPRKLKTHEPALRSQSGHSTLREKWTIPSRSDYWGLRVSTKEAKAAMIHLKHYTTSSIEIDDYLQKLSPDDIVVMAEDKPGSKTVEDIFIKLPPPMSWLNINHNRIHPNLEISSS